MRTLALIIGISLLMVIGLNLFPIIIFVFPLAFIVIGVKFNLRDSFLGILMTSILVGIIVDVASGISLFGVFGPMSLYISYGIIKRKKSVEIIIPSSVIIFISIILSLALLGNISGVSIIDELEESLGIYTEMQLSMLEDMEATNLEIFRIREEAENIPSIIVSILPSIFIIASVFISYINYYFSILILRKMGIGIRNNPRFSRFSLPNNFILGSLIMVLIIYLLKDLDEAQFYIIYLNLLVLIMSLLMIQGLALFDHLLISFKINIILRIIIIAITMFASSLATIAGIIDLIFDFRKLRKRKA